MKLTEHFSLEEMTRTSHRTADGNQPGAREQANLLRVCRWLERLRSEWNRRYGDGDDPVVVTSGYRSAAVNRAVGGSATSNHLTGSAADIRVYGMEQLLRYAVIILDISDETGEDFDELLLEKRGRTTWLHFAVREQGNRRKVNIINI